MKKLILFLLLIQLSLIGVTETYYVSNSGNDSNNGISPESSWLTISKVNSASLVAGDSILFKRGDSWFGQLIPKSGTVGNQIIYSVYGSGNKPVLHNSLTLNFVSDWTEESTNIWKTTATISVDVGNIILNTESFVGVKKFDKTDLILQDQFFYDAANDVLYIYSVGNPATKYTDVKACLSTHIVLMYPKSYVTIENISIKYGGAHGIQVTNSHHVTIRNCDVSWIGGGAHGDAPGRYGNGIEMYFNANDILIESCKVWECFDAAVSNQYADNQLDINQYNITYRNNQIWNCEYSYEYFNRSSTGTTHDVSFINNTCYNAGGGWGHSQRSSSTGYHLRLAELPPTISNFIIRNNIFHIAASLYQYNYDNSGKYDIDYNCIYQPTGNVSSMYFVTYANFAAYKTASGYDAHSINTDPLLNNVVLKDFSLMSNSLCLTSGYQSTYQGALQYSSTNPQGKKIILKTGSKYYINPATGKMRVR